MSKSILVRTASSSYEVLIDKSLFRNIGFVNCEWAFKGALKRDNEVKIFAEG